MTCNVTSLFEGRGVRNKTRKIDRIMPDMRKGRASITNGKRLLNGVDGRSHVYRRYRDLYDGYMRDSGGQHPELCKQAAVLVVQREALDAAVIRGETVDTLHLTRLAGAINRTIARLEKVSTKTTNNRTPLADYLASRNRNGRAVDRAEADG